MFRIVRIGSSLLVTAVLLVLAVVSGVLLLTVPRGNQTAVIAGLSAPVDIRFDSDGVPHIRAASDLDGAAALGFVHARDRMFQMDMMRRAASGRLSQIAGKATLRLDRMMRTLGLRARALDDLPHLPADTRAILEAYARGVNAWIAARGRFSAPEFIVLGRPDPWAPVDSLLWGKTMGLWLSDGWHTEIDYGALANELPPARLDHVWPDPAPALPPSARAAPAASFARLGDALPRFPAPFTWPPSASNAWAVDGRHSATGAPLLAGDPHLAFGLPGIWYLARIDTPHGVLAGATAPGVPFLVLGHNGHIAWTFTTTGADTQDVFVETPAGDGRYQTPDGPRPFTVHEEHIQVRGEPDNVLMVRETRHGPVISDLDGGEGPVLAVQMANLAAGDTAAAGLLALNRAQDAEAAINAASLITAPVQNMMVADAAHIALALTGRVPIRRGGDGVGPFDGADGVHDWTAFASGAALPQYRDPPSGRLLNANERVAPPDSPVFLGRHWFGDWRARRIRTLLDQSDRHTTADFAAMQTDVVSAYAQHLLPALRAAPAPAPGGIASRAQALLSDWDGSMVMDKPQPLIFNAWIARFRALVLQRANLTHRLPGDPDDFIASLFSPAGAGAWCNGDCTPLLTEALTTSVTDLAAQYGADPATWRWGRAHQAVFAHPILRALPIIGPLTTASLDTPGDSSTLDRGGTVGEDFTSVHGASYRGVYNLADLDRSLFMIAPGQSGNPVRQQARDFMMRWRDGGTIMLGQTPRMVAATLRLEP